MKYLFDCLYLLIWLAFSLYFFFGIYVLVRPPTCKRKRDRDRDKEYKCLSRCDLCRKLFYPEISLHDSIMLTRATNPEYVWNGTIWCYECSGNMKISQWKAQMNAEIEDEKQIVNEEEEFVARTLTKEDIDNDLKSHIGAILMRVAQIINRAHPVKFNQLQLRNNEPKYQEIECLLYRMTIHTSTLYNEYMRGNIK